MADQQGTELAETFAGVARELLAARTVDETLQKISGLAVSTVQGCEHAGVSLVRGREITTPAASDDVPPRVDAIQYEADQGPCLDAIRDHEVFRSDDLSAEERWPAFAGRAADETGVKSMLSFRLFADEEDTMGALNMYSKRPGAFDGEAEAIGAVLAAHAAVALHGAQAEEHLGDAVASRDVIGQAKGILMARQGVSADEAFDVLRRGSQRLNVKLRSLAERVVEQAEGKGGRGAPGGRGDRPVGP